jgi:hypothetical protein
MFPHWTGDPFSFQAAVADARTMPRYFFTVTYPDQEIDDTEGTLLSSDNAAIEYARRVIDSLREDQKPENSGPTIVVKNVAGDIIYRFPGN